MTHCGEKWVNMVEKHPEVCEMSEDYRRKIEYWTAICEQIIKRGFDRHLVFKKFPEGAARELKKCGSDAVREKALNYICNQLKRGEKVTAPDLKNSINGFEGGENPTSCSTVKRNTNVLSPTPEIDVEPTIRESLTVPPAPATILENQIVQPVAAPPDAQPIAAAPPSFRAPCLDNLPCPDGGYKVLPAKGSVMGTRCSVNSHSIKQLSHDECPLLVANYKKAHPPPVEEFKTADRLNGAGITAPAITTRDAERERRERLADELVNSMPGSAHVLVSDLKRDYPNLKTTYDIIFQALVVMSEKGGA